MSTSAMSVSVVPSRRARRAADAALRADVRRRSRIDRYALTPTPPPDHLIARILGAVLGSPAGPTIRS